jgi:hypothetical protein
MAPVDEALAIVPLDIPKVEIREQSVPFKAIVLALISGEGHEVTIPFSIGQARAMGETLIAYADELAAAPGVDLANADERKLLAANLTKN